VTLTSILVIPALESSIMGLLAKKITRDEDRLISKSVSERS